jgi:serine/threonine-protein kinase
VFDAFDEHEREVVSLKVVHPDICANPAFADAFDSTMRTAAALREPHLARILDWGSDRWNKHEARFVTVEQLTGGSLRDVLDRGRTLSPSQTLALGLDVLRALDVIHRAGLVHGDVRPSTIVFGDDRVPRLIDVGLGQLLAAVLWADALHVSNDRAMYVAPELAGQHLLVPKSDVYSLALTMLESVSGRVPFVGDSTVATLSNRMGKLLPVSADLGPLAAVLERAGRPDPEGRSTVPEFGQALVRTAERLPRPTPIPVLGGGLFDLDDAEATRHLDRPATSSAAAQRTLGAAAVATIAVEPGSVDGADAAPPDELGSVDAGDAAGPHDGDAAPDDGGGGAAPDDGEHGDLAAPSGPAAPLAPPGDATVAAEAIDPPALDATQAIDIADVPAPPEPTQAIAVADVAATQAIVVPPPSPAPMPAIDVPPPVEPTRLMPTAARVDDRTGGPPAPAAPVLYDEPLPGERHRRSRLWWLIPLVLILAAAGGAVAWYVTRTVSHTVPDLAGKSEGAALNEVAGLGWHTLTPQEASETVANGMVIRTDPTAGTELDEGKTLTIVVSTGPAPRPLPELKGMTLQQATDTLTQLGLNIVQGDAVFDDTIPSGSVVSWTVPDQPNLVAGNTVTKGVTVRVQLSKGPAPRLPELKGMTLDQATAALTGQQLKVSQGTPVNDETVPQGQVVSWSVPGQPQLVAGSVVDPGTTVELVLSNGPAPRTVPTLTGMTPTDAKTSVENLQLAYAQGPDEFSDTVPAGQVIRQDPAAGAQAPRGTTVTVVVSKGPDVVAVPDVTNMRLQQAQDTLSSAGLAVGTVTGNAAGVVTSATANGAAVTPGQTLHRGTAVDLTLS